MRIQVVVVFAAAVVLSACQTKTVEEMSYSERKQLASQIAKRCAEQGYGDGSPEMPACVKQEVSREVASRRREASREDAAISSYRAGPTMCRSYGASVVCF